MSRKHHHILYATTAVVKLCDSMIMLAVPWLILATTGSILQTGVAATVAQCAVVLGSVGSNRIISIASVRLTIVAWRAVSLICICGVIWCFSQQQLPWLWLLAFIAASRFMDAPGDIATESRFPEIARFCRIPLKRLNAVKESMETGALILGPAACGLLLATTDTYIVLTIIAACSVTGSILYIPLLVMYRRYSAEHQSIIKGMTWLWQTEHLRNYIILIMIIMATVSSVDDLILPVFVAQTSNNPADIGWILAAYGLAGLASSLVYARYHDRIADATMIKAGVTGIAMFFAGFVFLSSTPAIIISSFIAGILSGALGIVIDTRLLTDTPRHYRIPMLAASSTLALAVAPVAVILHTIAIEYSSVRTLCAFLTVILISYLLFTRR